MTTQLDQMTLDRLDNTNFVHVYRNIRKKKYSIKQHNKVIGHSPSIVLAAAMFRVQPKGRDKVRATGVKNVHAYINGIILHHKDDWVKGHEITYNPYTHDFFMMDGQPVTFLPFVLLDNEGKMWQLNKKEEND